MSDTSRIGFQSFGPILLAILSMSGCSSLTSNTAIKSFVSPYEVAGYKPGPGAAKYIFKSCPATPPPIRDFDLHMFYSDPPVNSKIDQQKYADFNLKQRAFQDYAKKVWYAANSFLFLESEQGAQCALQLLKDWAEQDALLGVLSKDPADRMAKGQALFVRRWVVGELASSYLKIRNAKSLNDRDKGVVLAWFRKLAAAVQKIYIEQPKLLTNNHATWAGAALLATAVVLSDEDLFEFSIQKFKETVDQIQDDGTLPQELARNEQALHYHHFTLTALALMSRFAESNGVDVWNYKDARVDRLVRLLSPSLKDPSSFAKTNGLKPDQEFVGGDTAWVELVYRRTHDAALRSYLQKSRPLEEYWFDWDMTAAFGEGL